MWKKDRSKKKGKNDKKKKEPEEKRTSDQRGSYFKAMPSSPTTSPASSIAATSDTFSVISVTEKSQQLSSDSEEEDIDVRSGIEREFFHYVSAGDTKTVQEYLRDYKEININIRDTEGLSPLHHAVNNDDEEMVNILLQENYDIEVYDALIQAIKNNSISMVQKIWEWKVTMRSKKPVTTYSKQKLGAESEFYGEEVTPLLVAAVCGHYEIIEFLYEKGERLGRLHLPNCDCPECLKSPTDLKKSNNRIELLKGMTNPTYISYMAGIDKTFDPILKSFELIEEVQSCLDEEPEFKDEYEAILENIKKFPVDLLGLCRNVEETKVLMSKRAGYNGVYTPFPRLLLAVEKEQKEFIAQENSQDIIYQEWIGEAWATNSPFESFLKKAVILIMLLFFPLISLVLWWTLCCLGSLRFIRFIVAPVNRYRFYVISHVIFLGVLFSMNTQEKGKTYVGPPSYYLPWVVGIFVISHFLSFLKHFLISPKRFLKNGWNKFELINHIFFFIAIALWIVVWSKVGARGTRFLGFSTKVEKDDRRGRTTPEPEVVERGYLAKTDVLLLSEIVTGVASAMAGLRLLKSVILHPTVGPIQVALGRMSHDILTFAVFFFVIIVSYALGMQHLYRPYGDVISNCIVCDFPLATEAFFWAMFTMTSAQTPDIPAIEFTVNGTKHTQKHQLTQNVGRIIFMSFHLLTVTFLFNMLTGTMSSTYGDIKDNVKVEWRYERTKLWIYYIQDTVLTAPFNIVPNCFFVINIFAWAKTMMGKGDGEKPSCDISNCCYEADDETEETRKDRERRYAFLMRRLLQRYFRSKSSNASEDAPTTEDVAEVQKRVAEIRHLATKNLELHSNPNSGTNIEGNSSTTGQVGDHHSASAANQIHKAASQPIASTTRRSSDSLRVSVISQNGPGTNANLITRRLSENPNSKVDV